MSIIFRYYRFLLIVLLLAAGNAIFAQSKIHWVDSVYEKMSLEERIGQLFMVDAYSNKGLKHQQDILQLIKDYKIGGLIFFQGHPKDQVALTNLYQLRSELPLLIGMDLEWGLGMRLDETLHYPRQMTLGALQNTEGIYRMGRDIAEQCKRIGVHISFSPVVDVNSNPDNPVIGMRSFGADREEVAKRGIAYMKGLQEGGVIACAKHFPGHGDTGSDSHYTLPVIKKNSENLDSLELYPFRRLVNEGVRSIMIAHLNVPSLEPTSKPTTLSKRVVTDLLREKMDFQGLIITDALNMGGVANYSNPGEVDLQAFKAGNDILLFPQNVPLAVKKIKTAIQSGEITRERLELSVKRILSAKYDVGLHSLKKISEKNLMADLNKNLYKTTIDQLYKNSLTLLKNEKNTLPLAGLEDRSIALLTLGGSQYDTLKDLYPLYAGCDMLQLNSRSPSSSAINNLDLKLTPYNTVVVFIRNIRNSRRNNHGISNAYIRFIRKLQKEKDVIVVAMGTPYSYHLLSDSEVLLGTSQDNENTASAVLQAIFGAVDISGRLPVASGDDFKRGDGLSTKAIGRLEMTYPERNGVLSEDLLGIDSIARFALDTGAVPGGQILVAHKGRLIYQNYFGHLSEKKEKAVDATTLYDMASVTKVAATMQLMMTLYEYGVWDPGQKVSLYLPALKNEEIGGLTYEEILTHQAGLQPYVPFWAKTKRGGSFKEEFYSDTYSAEFPNKVAEGLYAVKDIEDRLMEWLLETPMEPIDTLLNQYDYHYSDLGYYILKRTAEVLTSQSLDNFLHQNFYQPLGMYNTGFNPLNFSSSENIAPTENDIFFRKKYLRGYVHDQGAALLGGVAGHAGLFSTGMDMVKLMQMNLNEGYYGGSLYFKLDSTFDYFTSKNQLFNRRALGWDKPWYWSEGPSSVLASQSSFGHAGFTGTLVWADPRYDLVYVFLSNRINPKADNKLLLSLNIRTEIQDIVYKAVLKSYDLTQLK